MPPSGPPILELQNLRKFFGDTKAVDGVSGSFAAGEYVCVLGPSGCGKTTLLRLIAGFEQPTSGDIELDGRSLVGVPPERRDVNVVFQSYALFPHLSVRDNVSFGPRMKRIGPAEVAERTRDALRLVRMDDLGDRLPRQLSGGQQQRVALARALVNRPKVLVLDEPLSALDRSLRLAMQEELRAVQRRTGVTFVHITHDQSEALTLADRLVVMRGGRFVQVGSPTEVYERPLSRFVAEFLGSSNVLEGTADADGTVRLAGGGRLRALAGDSRPGPVLVSLRPERVQVEVADRAPPGDGNGPSGTVTRITSTGPLTECRIDLGGVTLIAHLQARPGIGEGERVRVTVPPEAVVLLPADEADAP